MDTKAEPRNPFYFLLLLASLAFVVTALAYAVVPVLEEKAKQRGQPSSIPFPESLRDRGWLWLLLELGAMILFGVLSMALDRWRRHVEEKRGKSQG
jgi:hypothetical protein